MKAYKGFNKDLTCRGFQYKEGETYHAEKAELCEEGFHARENPLDCFGYYEPGKAVYHEVEVDELAEGKGADSKVCGKTIKIGAALDVAGIFYALNSKLDDIFEEGVENRYARHATNNKLVRDWAYAHGFELFPEEKYGSVSLNCFKNNLNVDLPGLLDELKNRFKMTFNGGYGKIKGTTFRISNMGDETPETMKELLDNIDVILPNYINK